MSDPYPYGDQITAEQLQHNLTALRAAMGADAAVIFLTIDGPDDREYGNLAMTTSKPRAAHEMALLLVQTARAISATLKAQTGGSVELLVKVKGHDEPMEFDAGNLEEVMCR